MRPGRAPAARAHLPEANETQHTSATSEHYNEAEQNMMARIDPLVHLLRRRASLALARIAGLFLAFIAFTLLACDMEGDVGLEGDPTAAARATAQAEATAQARATAIARSPIQPLGPPLTFPNRPQLTVRNPVFSPDGKTMAAIGEDSSASDSVEFSIVLWDMSTREPLSSMVEPHGLVDGLFFTPEGDLLGIGPCFPRDAHARCAGSVYRWSVPALQLLGEMAYGHSGTGNAAALSPDGRRLAFGTSSGADLWDIAAGKLVGSMAADQGEIDLLAFSADSRLLALGSQGVSTSPDVISIWDVTTLEPVGTSIEVRAYYDHVRTLAFSPDGEILATQLNDGIVLWEVATRRMLGGSLPAERSAAMAFSPDGRLLAVGAGDGLIILIDPQSRQAVQVPLDASVGWHFVSDIAFTPDSKILAVVGRDHASIFLLDLTPAQSGDLFDAVTATPALTSPTKAAASPSATPRPCEGAEVVFQAGDNDNFDPSNGTEPSQPGDLLRAVIESGHADMLMFEGLDKASRVVRNFDEAGSDQWFGHTFASLHTAGSRICAATLEIRAENGKGGTMALLFMTDYFPDTGMVGYEYGWSEAWDDLPETGSDGVVRLNLDALPLMGGTVTVLNSLNDHGFLDVVIHDDLTVDYLILTLRYAVEPAATNSPVP